MRPNAVTLMTIHSAKGKEFDHVYMIGRAEDILPIFQSVKAREQNAEMEDERPQLLCGNHSGAGVVLLLLCRSLSGVDKAAPTLPDGDAPTASREGVAPGTDFTTIRRGGVR